MRFVWTWALVAALLLTALPAARPALAVAAPRVSITPTQFSVNADGDREFTNVSVQLAEAAGLTVVVLNSAGSGVRLLQPQANKPAGVHRYVFNGKVQNTAGRWVNLPEGAYYVRATTRGADNSTAIHGAKVVINNTISRASVASTPMIGNGYPGLFSPNGDGAKDGVVAGFTLKRPANVVMSISVGGRLVRSIQAGFIMSGVKSMSWNGMVMSGSSWVWASPGTYTIRLAATPRDPELSAQLGSALADRTIVAETSRPTVSTSVSSSSINTTNGGRTTLSYRLNEVGYRRIAVVSSGGAAVYTTDVAATATTGSFTWGGRRNDGTFVTPGRYYIQLYVRDRAANAATAYPTRNTVTVTRGGYITGQAARKPWNGYWWPHLNTYTYKLYNDPGPMTKLDTYLSRTNRTVGAQKWEYANHRTTDPAKDWWGHCQAWAAASTIEPQPNGVTRQGVSFSQDDAEGLYSETWTHHEDIMYGTRYSDSDGRNSEAYKDIHPAEYDQVVQYWIGEQKTALHMDFTTSNAIWNYPVYRFERRSTFSGNREYVTMKVFRASPTYGSSGSSPVTFTFYYTLQDGTNGLWYNPSGNSTNTHPDYVAKLLGRSEDYGNPYVSPSVLNEIFR